MNAETTTSPSVALSGQSGSIMDYVRLARPDHWFKNIFMVPGMVFAYMYFRPEISFEILQNLAIGILATCLIASANYVINEWLDAEFDRHHPVKKFRPSVTKKMSSTIIYTEYVMLGIVGLGLGYTVSNMFFLVLLLLLIMGFLYNVRPFRTKDRAYIDVLSESINNPIRFVLGWLIFAPFVFPPSSVLVAYWMGGAFLMASKRFAEYRFINNKSQAALYRKSFGQYDETSLLISAFYYAVACTFFLGIFLIKHRIELLLTFPFLALMFSWYLRIAHRSDSTAQRPEELYKNWKFMIFIGLLCILFIGLLFIDIEWLSYFLENNMTY